MNAARVETTETPMHAHSFRELDQLILQLKGLVLVRKLRRRAGANQDELAMYAKAIEQTRDQLAKTVAAPLQAAA